MNLARDAIVKLLDERGADKTICPSEVARALAGTDGDWRSRMDEVHECVDGMADEGQIILSWKGRRLSKREGPYRISGSPR